MIFSKSSTTKKTKRTDAGSQTAFVSCTYGYYVVCIYGTWNSRPLGKWNSLASPANIIEKRSNMSSSNSEYLHSVHTYGWRCTLLVVRNAVSLVVFRSLRLDTEYRVLRISYPYLENTPYFVIWYIIYTSYEVLLLLLLLHDNINNYVHVRPYDTRMSHQGFIWACVTTLFYFQGFYVCVDKREAAAGRSPATSDWLALKVTQFITWIY